MKGILSQLDLPAPHASLNATGLAVTHACGHLVHYNVGDSYVETVNRLGALHVEPCIECVARALESVHPAIECSPPTIDRATIADVGAVSAARLDAMATITRFLIDDRRHMLMPRYYRRHFIPAAWYATLGALLESGNAQFWAYVDAYGLAQLIEAFNRYFEMRRVVGSGQKERPELGDPLQLLIHRQLHHWGDMDLIQRVYR